MPIVFSAITPHPPLAIPSIGKDHVKHLKKTLDSFKKIEQDVYASKPETIIILSPHGKILQDAININLYPEYIGNFEDFGDYSTRLVFKSDPMSIQNIRSDQETYEKNILTLTSEPNVDYGIAIPLYFILQHMKDIPIIPINPCGKNLKIHYEIGAHLKRIISRINKRFAIICSGELSHKLTKDAPGGFSPQAEIFDKTLIELLKKKNPEGILELDPNLSDIASECCLKVMSLMFGMISDIQYTMEILSYEFPYGVGYLSAEMILQ